MKRNVMTVAVLAYGLAFGGNAFADTIAWWRFGDLGAEGGKAAAGAQFTNFVDSAKYPAVAHSFNGYTPGTDATYMPSLVKLDNATSGLVVYDPISDTSLPFSTAMSCPWGGDGSQKSGGATVEMVPELYGAGENQTGDFTFECFFRTSAESMARSASMAAIAVLKSPNDMGAWSLLVYNKKLWARCAFDGVPNMITCSPQGTTEVTPDVWHHAAFTYCCSNRTVKLYLDYNNEATWATGDRTGTGRIKPKEGEPLCLGKGLCINKDRSLAGEMAEARISDVALEPDRFLRFREASVPVDRATGDPDTVMWLSLDSAESIPRQTFLTANPKLVQSGFTNRRVRLVVPGTAVEPVVTNETRAAKLRGSYTSDEEFDDSGALAVLTNNCPSGYIQVEGLANSLAADSFTQEFFFRTAHPVDPDDGANRASYGLASSGFMKLLVVHKTGQGFCRFKCTGNVTKDYYTSGRVDDGNWHHFAFVYDAKNLRISVYCDGVSFGTLSDSKLVGNSSLAYVFAHSNDIESQYFDGLVDEIRITRRALACDEFMTAKPRSDSSPLAQIRFEDNTAMEPYGCKAVLGKAAPNASGASVPSYTNTFAAEIDRTKGGNERIANAKAMKFNGGSAYWPQIRAIEKTNVTIEFFWRPYEVAAPWPVVLGLSNSEGASVNVCNGGPYFDMPWFFHYHGAWGSTFLEMGFCTTNFEDVAEVNATVKTYVKSSPTYKLQDSSAPSAGYSPITAGCDGKWHHVAATIEEIVEDSVTKTRVTTYWDYKQLSQQTATGTVIWGDTGHWLTIGLCGQNARLARWDMDEIRISDGILKPEEFQHKSRRGIYIIIR